MALPCLIFEDDDLLVVNKPAGLNTHAPAPFSGEGLYEWLRHREPRWANLALIHRLDKDTSGVIVFAKSRRASQSLTVQFTRRAVEKKYLLLTDRPAPAKPFTIKTALVRSGEKYLARPAPADGEIAETRFRPVSAPLLPPNSAKFDLPPQCNFVEAEPLTGRTHQIRVHAADQGFPVFGDALYGGTPAARVYLHAAELALQHPATGEKMVFHAPPVFQEDPRLALRLALLDSREDDACRLIHGAADGWPGWCVERLGPFLLSQSKQPLSSAQLYELDRLKALFSLQGVYHKVLRKHLARTSLAENSPQLVLGQAAPERFIVRENGIRFHLGFHEGYSVGLFLDQRENRRRLLTGHIAAEFPLNSAAGQHIPEILNVFAYTCAFSLCAAKAGARATSLDLSKKSLEWGKQNFILNHLDPANHDFIYGDAFDWFGRLRKKARLFDVILLDPPTFSQSRTSGAFRVEKDYASLILTALPLLKPGGLLFASANAANWPAEEFLAAVKRPLAVAKRPVLQEHYFPQPPDFPISRVSPAYLKTVWLRVD